MLAADLSAIIAIIYWPDSRSVSICIHEPVVVNYATINPDNCAPRARSALYISLDELGTLELIINDVLGLWLWLVNDFGFVFEEHGSTEDFFSFVHDLDFSFVQCFYTSGIVCESNYFFFFEILGLKED